jgi:ADP-ribose pyrophosphatase YjhB (NUDIX family)
MSDYETPYLGQLRQSVGDMKLISVGTRAIIQNQKGHILLVQRKDNQEWVMPAGSLKREVSEETGLTVIDAELIAVYSEPRFSYVTAYGYPYQMVRLVFLVKQWSGELETQTDETINARFFALDAIPKIPELYKETLDDLRDFAGKVILK